MQHTRAYATALAMVALVYLGTRVGNRRKGTARESSGAGGLMLRISINQAPDHALIRDMLFLGLPLEELQTALGQFQRDLGSCFP